MLNFVGINVKEAGSDDISGLFCGRRVDRGTNLLSVLSYYSNILSKSLLYTF